jgi:hypothetical protein
VYSHARQADCQAVRLNGSSSTPGVLRRIAFRIALRRA